MTKQHTIKVSMKAYKKLIELKKKTGVTITFMIDLAVKYLEGKS